MKKFKIGRPCIIDKGNPLETPGVLIKVPFKNQFGEWFVHVATVAEDMNPKTYKYYSRRFDVRILKERVVMK